METVLLSLSKSDLQDLIIESVATCLKKQQVNTKADKEEANDLLTIQQASTLITLSVPTLYGLVSRKIIPSYKKGKRLYFSKTELLAWVKSGRNITNADIINDVDTFLSTLNKTDKL